MVVGDAHFWQRTSRIYTRRRILFLHSRIILNKGVSILQDIRLDLSLRGFKYPCSTMALLLQPMLLLYMCRVLLALTTSFQGIGRLYLRVQHTRVAKYLRPCVWVIAAIPVPMSWEWNLICSNCDDTRDHRVHVLEPGGIFQCSIFPV